MRDFLNLLVKIKKFYKTAITLHNSCPSFRYKCIMLHIPFVKRHICLCLYVTMLKNYILKLQYLISANQLFYNPFFFFNYDVFSRRPKTVFGKMSKIFLATLSNTINSYVSAFLIQSKICCVKMYTNYRLGTVLQDQRRFFSSRHQPNGWD